LTIEHSYRIGDVSSIIYKKTYFIDSGAQLNFTKRVAVSSESFRIDFTSWCHCHCRAMRCQQGRAPRFPIHTQEVRAHLMAPSVLGNSPTSPTDSATEPDFCPQLTLADTPDIEGRPD